MPEVSNGIPTGGTLPGINEQQDFNTAQNATINDLTTALDKQMDNQQGNQGFRDNIQDKGEQDKVDTKTKDQIEAEKKAQEEVLIAACIAKAIEMHKADFERNNMQISSVKTLSLSGQDKTDTVRLDISSIEDNFQMYFDENANLILENHRDCPEKNMIGDQYLDELDDPDKQKAFADRADIAKERTTLSKDQIDKQIQEMGFENKADLEQATGMDLSGSMAGAQLQQNNLKQQIGQELMENADGVISTRSMVNNTQNIGDITGNKDAKYIAVKGSQTFAINEKGEAENANLKVAPGGSTTVIDGNIVKDERTGAAFYSNIQPNMGMTFRDNGTPVVIQNLGTDNQLGRKIGEQPNSNTGKINDTFDQSRTQDARNVAEAARSTTGYDLVKDAIPDYSTSAELAKIAKEYDIDEGKVHAIHQGLLASGKTQQEAMAATREQCEAIDRAERGEPPEPGERTLGPQGNPNA